jgi:hypothetical protein
VYGMIRYAQDYQTCRKIFFESYFSNDPTVSSSEYSGRLLNTTSMDRTCELCDNCRRKKGDGLHVVSKDITLEAMTAVKIANTAQMNTEERVTMIKMVQYMRGRGLKKGGLEDLFKSENLEVAAKKKWTDAVSCEAVITLGGGEGKLSILTFSIPGIGNDDKLFVNRRISLGRFSFYTLQLYIVSEVKDYFESLQTSLKYIYFQLSQARPSGKTFVIIKKERYSRRSTTNTDQNGLSGG